MMMMMMMMTVSFNFLRHRTNCQQPHVTATVRGAIYFRGDFI